MWRELLELFSKQGCVLNADDFPWKTTKGSYTAKPKDKINRFEKKYGLTRKDAEPYNESAQFNSYEPRLPAQQFKNNDYGKNEQQGVSRAGPSTNYMSSNSVRYVKGQKAQNLNNVSKSIKQITANIQTRKNMQNKNEKVPHQENTSQHQNDIDHKELSYSVDNNEFPFLLDSNINVACIEKTCSIDSSQQAKNIHKTGKNNQKPETNTLKMEETISSNVQLIDKKQPAKNQNDGKRKKASQPNDKCLSGQIQSEQKQDAAQVKQVNTAPKTQRGKDCWQEQIGSWKF